MAKKDKTLEVTVNLKQFEEIVLNELNTPEGEMPATLLVCGEAGGGKTSITEQLCKRAGFDTRMLRLSQIDPTDLAGIPYLSEDKNFDGNRLARFAQPALLPNWDEKCVIILDEPNRGRAEVKQAAFQMMEGRGTISWKFNPDKHRIIALMNPANAQYHVDMMDPAMVNRCVLMHFKPELKEFLEYGYAVGIDERILQFLQYEPENLSVISETVDQDVSWATQRSWHRLSQSTCGRKLSTEAYYTYAAGCVGPDVAAAYIAFCNDPDRPVKPSEVFSGYTKDLQQKFISHQCDEKIDKALSTTFGVVMIVNNTPLKQIDINILKTFYSTINNDEVRTAFIKGLEVSKEKDEPGKWDALVRGMGVAKEALEIAREVQNIKLGKKK
jgi:GTPase SAR1 family protein